MALHVWTVLCEASIIDSASNRMSLINALEAVVLTLPPEEWPVDVPLRFDVVSMWTRSNYEEPEEAVARLSVVGPTQTTHGDPYNIKLSGEFQRFRHQTHFLGAKIGAPGLIWFVVELQNGDEWIEVARVPLEVKYVSEER